MLSSFSQLPDIITMGDRIFDPHWATKFHRDKYCELLLVMEGRVRTVFYRSHSITAGPGEFILIPAGTLHRDEFDLEKGMKVFMITFNWPHEQAFFKLLPPRTLRDIGEESRRVADTLCERMRRLLESGTQADLLLCRVHLLTILLTILHGRFTASPPPRRAQDRGRKHRREIMLLAREYLDTHFAQEISLEHIAGRLRISPFYLSHVFSQENDFSLMEYLTNRRMQEAKLLLQRGQHSIKEIAFAVGYKDGNYFSKVFHRHFGFAPRELRQALPAKRPGGSPANRRKTRMK